MNVKNKPDSNENRMNVDGGKRINNTYPEYEMRNMKRKKSRKNARNASRKSQRGGKPMLNW